MLIKIDNDRYINSDHIIYMSPAYAEHDRPHILLTGGCLHYTDWSIIEYIAKVLDTNDALTITEQPQQLSLPSRLAHFLRNQSAGIMFQDIQTAFPQEPIMAIQAALNELDASNTIRALGTDESSLLYYHASNAIFGTISEEF